MDEVNGAVVVKGDPRKVMGRPRKDEYVLQVTVTRKARGTYVKGTSRSVNFLNAPWDTDAFVALVERMARKEAGGKVPSRPTTRQVLL